MKRIVFAFIIFTVACASSCSKSEQPTAMMDLESKDTLSVTNVTPAEPLQPAAPVEEHPMLPPALEEPAAPVFSVSAIEIQQALKNAGLYEGEIDGKIGPKTKQATRDFQAQNGLKVDGKVGPKTWEKLKAYLEAPHIE